MYHIAQLGSSEHVQLVYDFAVGCCQEFVRNDPVSQVLLSALMAESQIMATAILKFQGALCFGIRLPTGIRECSHTVVALLSVPD